MRLIAPEESPPTIVQGAGSDAPFLIICDHAGREVPRRLGDLGLPAAAFERHIAWDLGAGDLSVRLGEALGAGVIRQRYSRLVIDCNRDPARPDAVPETSDGTPIPGNLGLDAAARAARVEAVHAPYHAAIARELDGREARGLRTALACVHSFTPRLADGADRPWRFGVLHLENSPLSRAMLALLMAEVGTGLVGDNEPYAMDQIDYSAPRHAIARGHDYLELEVRQDLLANESGRAEVAAMIARLLPRALEQAGG